MSEHNAKRVCEIVKTDEEEFEFFLKVDEERKGQIITAITSDGPADKAGLKNDDRVLEINGKDVSDHEHNDIVEIIRKYVSKNRITFTVIDRANDPNTPKTPNPVPRICKIKKKNNSFGFFLEAREGETGHYMKEVVQGGPAVKCGLRAGDRLVSVNGNQVDNRTHEDVVAMVKKSGNKVTLLVIDTNGYDVLSSRGVDITEDLIKRKKKSKSSSSSKTSVKSPSESSVSKIERSMSQTSGIQLDIAETPENKIRIVHLFKPNTKTYGFFLRVKKGETKERIGNLEPGGMGHVCGLKDSDMLFGVNGQTTTGLSHDEIIKLVKAKQEQVVVAVVDNSSHRYIKNIGNKVGPENYHKTHSYTATKVDLEKENDTYGFFLKMEANIPLHIIADVEDDGPAAKAGVTNGEVILNVNGSDAFELSHKQCVEKIREKGSTVLLITAPRKSADFFYKLGVKVTEQTIENWPTADELFNSNYSLPSISPRESVSEISDRIEEEATPKPEVKYLPKLCKVVKRDGGFGFFLRDEDGHYLGNVEKGGPADEAGIKDNDRIVEINGLNMEEETHDDVVGKIRSSGDDVSFLVVEREADEFFKKNKIFITVALLETDRDEPVYTAVSKVKHFPRLCILKRQGSAGYGFHLNGEVGREGQFLKKIVSGAASDVAGIQEGDKLIEVNGENIENETHDNIVQRIKRSGDEVTFLVVDHSAENYFRSKNITISSALLMSTKEEEKNFDTVSKSSSVMEIEAHVHQEDVIQKDIDETVEIIASVVVDKEESESDKEVKEAIDALHIPTPPPDEEFPQPPQTFEDLENKVEEAIEKVEETKQEERKEEIVEKIEEIVEDTAKEDDNNKPLETIAKVALAKQIVEEVKQELEEREKEAASAIAESVVEDINEEVKEEIQEKVEEDLKENIAVAVTVAVAEEVVEEIREEKIKNEIVEEVKEEIKEEILENGLNVTKEDIIEEVKEETKEVLENGLDVSKEEIVEEVKEEIREEALESNLDVSKDEKIIEEFKEEIREEVLENVAEVVKEEVEENNTDDKMKQSLINEIKEITTSQSSEDDTTIQPAKVVIAAAVAKNIADDIEIKESTKENTVTVVKTENKTIIVNTTNMQQDKPSGGPVFSNTRSSVRAQRALFENGSSSYKPAKVPTVEKVVESPTTETPAESIDTAKKSLVASIRESIEKRNQSSQNGNVRSFQSRYKPGVIPTTTIDPKRKTIIKSEIRTPNKQMSWTGDGLTINIVELNQNGN